MSLADLTATQKEELVVSLSALLLQDSGVDMSAENIEAVIKVRPSGGQCVWCVYTGFDWRWMSCWGW